MVVQIFMETAEAIAKRKTTESKCEREGLACNLACHMCWWGDKIISHTSIGGKQKRNYTHTVAVILYLNIYTFTAGTYSVGACVNQRAIGL